MNIPEISIGGSIRTPAISKPISDFDWFQCESSNKRCCEIMPSLAIVGVCHNVDSPMREKQSLSLRNKETVLLLRNLLPMFIILSTVFALSKRGCYGDTEDDI